MKYLRPSGTYIEVSDTPANRIAAKSLGWVLQGGIDDTDIEEISDTLPEVEGLRKRGRPRKDK